MADLTRKTANLYSGYTIGVGINATTGAQESDNQAATSDYIEINSTTTYTISGLDGNLRSFINAYNVDKQSLGRTAATERTSLTFDSTSFTGGTSQGTGDIKYIRIKQYKAVASQPDITDIQNYNIMLNLGSTPLPYEPYGWLHSLRKLTTATDTLTSLPADLYADGTNATVGLKGNMSQTGTPTPQNPIQPQETGERTGNLFDDHNIITISNLGDRYGVVLPEGTYSIYNGTDNIVYDGINDFQNRHVACEAHSTATITLYTDPNTTCGFLMSLNAASQGGVTIVSGSTPPSSYIPYGYKIPISSAGQTTPVYLGEVQTTRKIKKLVLTGEEAFTQTSDYQQSSRFRLVINDALRGADTYTADTIISTHYKSETGFGIGTIVQSNGIDINCTFCMQSSEYPDLTTFKAYLAAQYTAGTPVTIWYVLATETTGIVNEPLRKIGDYVDTVSGITIPTITGKDTFDVETTLKPSEVELTYTGWHDATVKEWDGSQWNE